MNAELILDLGMAYPKETSKKKSHYGIFLCNQCHCEFKSTFQSIKNNSGICKSCASANKPHPIRHGESKTKLYTIYQNMVARCYNPKTANFEYYGGKGITICDEWKNTIDLFFLWAHKNGYTEGLSLDRIDNSKGYSPSNCRWVTWDVQCANKGLRSNNTSKRIGIHWHKVMGKWQAKVQTNGVEKRLGYFDNLEDAVKCRRKYIEDNNLPHAL